MVINHDSQPPLLVSTLVHNLSKYTSLKIETMQDPWKYQVNNILYNFVNFLIVLVLVVQFINPHRIYNLIIICTTNTSPLINDFKETGIKPFYSIQS